MFKGVLKYTRSDNCNRLKVQKKLKANILERGKKSCAYIA